MDIHNPLEVIQNDGVLHLIWSFGFVVSITINAFTFEGCSLIKYRITRNDGQQTELWSHSHLTALTQIPVFPINLGCHIIYLCGF